MATKNYVCRITPPGIPAGPNKSFFRNNNTWVQGSSIGPNFTYSPTANIYTYTDAKNMYGSITDGTLLFVQNDEGAPSFAPYHQHYFIGSLFGTVIDDSNRDIIPQADVVMPKLYQDITNYPNSVNARMPNLPGKSKLYAIQNKAVYPFRKLFRDFTYDSEGIEYVRDSSTTNPSAYPIVGCSSWYSSGGTYEKKIVCVSDAVLGLYFSFGSAVETGNQFPIASNAISASKNYYGVVGPTFQADASGSPIGAFQIPYYKAPQSMGGGSFMKAWGSDVDTVTYENAALSTYCKYACSYIVNGQLIKTDIVTPPSTSGELFDQYNYFIHCPIIETAFTGLEFHPLPFCKKITAEDIDAGSNMEFLIGKYLVWTAHNSLAVPTLVSEAPEEAGWLETISEADYSKRSPCFFGGGSYPQNHYVAIFDTSGANLSGDSKHIFTHGENMYMSLMMPASFATSGGETQWDTPDSYITDVYRVNDDFGYFGGANASMKLYQALGKLYNSDSMAWEDATDPQAAIIKCEYSPSWRGMKQTGFAVPWTAMTLKYSEGSDPTRLYEIEFDASDLGIDHPQDSHVSYRYAMRFKHPDPNIGWDAPYNSALYYLYNKGTLPYPYRINPLQLVNPIGIEMNMVSGSQTMLKGYYRPELLETLTTKDIFVSNGESIGTFTSTGSPSAGNFKFTLANAKCHCEPDHAMYASSQVNDAFVNTEHKHMLLIIHKGTGMYYGGNAAGGIGNSLWYMKEFWITSPTLSYTTFTDGNGVVQYDSSWTDWNVKDTKKNSGYYIILADMVPFVELKSRTQSYNLKMCTIAKWDVQFNGAVTKIFDVNVNGMID
jgi:hypothetical protein